MTITFDSNSSIVSNEELEKYFWMLYLRSPGFREKNDTLRGEDGDDILIAQDGTDTLYGGDGADIFLFDDVNTNSDTIADFNLAQNDKIDLSILLQGYDPLTDAITDFVQITTSGANSLLKIDADGGGNSFTTIATITGVAGLTDEAALVSSGNLIVS